MQFAVCIAALSASAAIAQDYEVRRVAVDKTTKYRCFRNGHHFLTILDERQAVVIRPHPGVDPNGWGNSLYLQPFLPGAVLGHTTVPGVTASKAGISLDAHGSVSRGPADTYGTWTARLAFRYDAAAKRLDADGGYTIALAGPLAEVGDLNLLKIASNWLRDVPLVTGGKGDTGDMQNAVIAADSLKATWDPAAVAAYFPQDRTDSLAVTVTGRLNLVDASAQGHAPIAPAYKPSLYLALKSKQPGTGMVFGAVFDAAKARQFWEDNIGITPLVPRSFPQTRFDFRLALRSDALPDDGKNPRAGHVGESLRDSQRSLSASPACVIRFRSGRLNRQGAVLPLAKCGE